ncbi:hypothetical protein KHA93_20430 [Bacillus sp. FJAT-49732]|uniref:FIMAH domain-containing protein n=1 Tax=Lederbergia citrisecunda TaxID=2833583 RepID=A0A942YMS6_9BACI|nr:hypothetical protein [Lederbergia citrisecunda]MBS4201977.1 hypothetical protein [Lederbergia citrisecunda]
MTNTRLIGENSKRIFIIVITFLMILPSVFYSQDVVGFAAAPTPDQTVTDMINALDVTSLDDREGVVLARRYYTRLSAAQKALVTNLQSLEKAEAEILKLWIDSAEVNTLVDEGIVGVLREEYDALKPSQKALITNVDKLDQLDAKHEGLMEIKDQNYAKAKEVQSIIEQMQVLSYSDKPAAANARAAYDSLTGDQKAIVTNYHLLKEAENKISAWEGGSPVHKAPENIVYAGTRSSDYGVNGQWLGTEDWQHITDQMDGYFPGAEPTYIWIIGRLNTSVGAGGVRLEFEQPNDGVDYASKNISFGPPTKAGHLTHEEYLDYFDKHGIKVYLQVESGFADMKTLMDLIFNKYGHHESVVGFGVDVEWYYGISEDAGIPVTDTRAQEWDEHLKSINPSYRMFLKHYNHRWLPPTYRSDILFCDDSQSIGSIDGEVEGMYEDSMGFIPEFKAWADYFYPNEVLYQIGYRPDAMWYYPLEKPVIKDLGERLAEVTRQNLGIAWVDFTIKDPLTFPALFKADSEVVTAVNTLVGYLRSTGNNMVGRRFAAGEGTLTDALYVAEIRKVVNSLTDSQRNALNQSYLENLINLEPKAVDIRINNLDITKLQVKDKAKVADIRATYTALTVAQKAQVTQLSHLEAAEKALAAIKEDGSRKALADLNALLEHFVSTGDINGPSVNQLSNRLDQVEQHLNAGRTKQVAQHLDQFKSHLNQPPQSKNVSNKAKESLNKMLNTLNEKL